MSRRTFILLNAVVAALSWAGLAGLVLFTRAPLPARVAFFILLFLALTATCAPLLLYLNARFAKTDKTPGLRRPLRQSVWVALFFVICAWLQMIRVLHWIVAVLLIVIFVLLETFFTTRDTA
ncbi:MAG: hypothetical protein H5T62_13015 [Anaerolineae bacterium]|nr:hypothetical protein [Anaerolineae bacterium]